MQFFVEFFVPHSKNGHRAKLLHPSSLFIFLSFLVVLQLFLRWGARTSPQILGVAIDIRTERLLEKTNAERQRRGLAPLTLSPDLSFAAQNKAKDMFAKNYWAHTSPDGKVPWEFIINAGYRYIYAGENLAKDFQTSDSVLDAWMASPTHRANVLRPEYKDIGFAVVNGKLNGEETTLVVQMFGTSGVSARPTEGTSLSDRGTIGNDSVLGIPEKLTSQNIFLNKPLVDVISLSRFLSLFLAGLMLTVLLIDGFVLWRKKIFRVSGHNLAHLIFLGSLFGTVWFYSLGVIL